MPNNLIIPTTHGTLDAFNTQKSNHSKPSQLNLIGDNVPTLLIIGLYSYLYQHHDMYGNDTNTFKLADLRNYLGLSRGGKSMNVKSALLELNGIMAFIEDKSIPLASVEVSGHYVTIRSQYFHYLTQTMKTNALGGSRYTSLVHTDIISAKNQSATEVAIEIVKVVERRGAIVNTPAHMTIRTLVDRCPTLRYKLTCCASNGRKNQLLADTLIRSIDLIGKYTELHNCYHNLVITIPEKIKIDTLHHTINVVHEGRRKDNYNDNK